MIFANFFHCPIMKRLITENEVATNTNRKFEARAHAALQITVLPSSIKLILFSTPIIIGDFALK